MSGYTCTTSQVHGMSDRHGRECCWVVITVVAARSRWSKPVYRGRLSRSAHTRSWSAHGMTAMRLLCWSKKPSRTALSIVSLPAEELTVIGAAFIKVDNTVLVAISGLKSHQTIRQCSRHAHTLTPMVPGITKFPPGSATPKPK